MLVELPILMLIGLVLGLPMRYVVARFLLLAGIVVVCGGYIGDLTITLGCYTIGLVIGNFIRRIHDKCRNKKNELL